MTPRPRSERDARALRLLAALDAYEQGVEALKTRGYDPELYAWLSKQFDILLLSAREIPEVSIAWVTLLISRTGITHCLWRSSRDAADSVELAQRYAAHKAAIDGLRKAADRARTKA
jgi:hypothetical protein